MISAIRLSRFRHIFITTIFCLIRFAKQVLHYHAKRFSLATVWPFYAIPIHTLAATSSRLKRVTCRFFHGIKIYALECPPLLYTICSLTVFGWFRTTFIDFWRAIESKHEIAALFFVLGFFIDFSKEMDIIPVFGS